MRDLKIQLFQLFVWTISTPFSRSVMFVIIRFFINPPSMLVSSVENKRLELFKLQFNLVEFLTFLSEKFINNYDKLEDFKKVLFS